MGQVLVTGCAGFIGFHVAKALLAGKEYNMDDNSSKRCFDFDGVIGLDNLNDYYDVSLKNSRLNILQDHKIMRMDEYGIGKAFTFYKASLEDADALSEIFDRHDISHVIHLAAQAGVRYSIENPKAYVYSNLLGFFNILEECRKHKVKHLVFASSSSVYGSNAAVPFSETDNVDHPLSFYAATKKANELMAHSYSHIYGIPVTGLRFFTVYGPWGRPDMALFKFTEAILGSLPIHVYNYGKMQRDFTYIDDAVEAVIAITGKAPGADLLWDPHRPDPATSSAPYRIYNIGGNKPVELDTFISILEEKLGRKAVREYMPMQPGDVPATAADTRKLESVIGYKPDTPLETGIERFVDWYREYYG